MRRRMTVIEGGAGELALHSAIALQEEDLENLDRLGNVSLILVPNSLRCMDERRACRSRPTASLFLCHSGQNP